MGLIQRKPRPLTRDVGSFRDDRLFIIACDDTHAPKQYFNFFQLGRIQVHVVPTEDGTSVAKHVLDRLLKFEREDDDELWMLLDTDHCPEGTHLQGFLSALQEARQRGVKVALSKPCFELWLLLHRVEESEVTVLENAKAVDATLRQVIGEYNKTNLKSEHFPLSLVLSACKRAKQLDEVTPGGDRPEGNTTRVYLLWEAIVAKALPSQLPAELHELLL
jgi:hypothetical protein